MKIFGVYSAGGFGREIHRLLDDYLLSINEADFEIVFIDDAEELIGQRIHDLRILSADDFLSLEASKSVCIAFADKTLRRKKVELMTASNIPFFSVVASTAIIGNGVDIGPGAILADNTAVTCDATIGAHFHCNIYSYVNHDCVVGDFVTLGPRVSLNGRIVVEDDVYIGSDATFLPGKPGAPLVVGKGAVVGAGAVVTKSVEAGAVMVGNPARPL